MTTVVTTKNPTKQKIKRYYRRFLRRWNNSVYMYSHFKISVSGFIQFANSTTVVLPPQITFLPDTASLTSSYSIIEVLHFSPRFVSLCNIFDNLSIRSASVRVFKNVTVGNPSQYVPNSLYFGFYYGENVSYDLMVGSENCRLINYNGATKFYCKFKSKMMSIKELIDGQTNTLRLGTFANIQGNIQNQPTFNFNIDFYITFNNCKV